MRRLASLPALALVAASCGGSSTTSSPPPTTSSTVAAVSTAHPHATALAALTRCRAAVARLQFATVAKADVDAAKQRVAAASSACGAAAALTRLVAGSIRPTRRLQQAADAEAALADSVANYGHYLDHVADGTSGQKILGFSVEELRQAKLLLADALTELR